jgi:hypothetical protein
MPAPRRTRFAALLAAAAVSGGALGACGRENPSQGNNGGNAGNGTLQTQPSTLGSHTTPDKKVHQQQHSVTSTTPSQTITQPSTTLGQTNSNGG